MQKTGIEWVRNPDGTQGFTVNIVVGCSGDGCAVRPVCFAMRQAKRQKWRCLKCYNFEPHNHYERIYEVIHRKKPAGILLDSMGDLFDKAFSDPEICRILGIIRDLPQHRFYIKTKQAQRLPKFNTFGYPQNLWLLVSVNDRQDVWRINYLRETNATVKGVSFEPLYEPIEADLSSIQWVIIGGQTRPFKPPQMEWVQRLVKLAREADASIFIKDSITPLYLHHFPPPQWGIGSRIQEFPNVA